ncbi:putative ribonuclease H-like domain-containing protein [Tanacetum coccineum]|uniref:Ribonuclease H-like domain-containing protein n=1 Tax=Tanacetum coccineum TaxID=301880 RepID=A0ABQ5F4D3_9ASTR
MYSVDLKNIVPKGGLTCLFAKATSDESKLWHRKLGHLKFKTMNKLVKRNLVRGLPSKLFENDQTCVACQKGKQHRASCKSKTENSISLPLHWLHMVLFGPTFVKSLMKKMYCLVVTDDYSRFTWVFFLATKDETSGILKSFITWIENLVDHKVKSIARTPQQNRVAERRNRTLIKAARTILADSKLPTTFWAEAVNTACYVHNRLPFGCTVTIPNTIDHLGKFNGKANEGFFVGYSLNSKVFRVFNSRTRIVEENLHIRFSESTPNVSIAVTKASDNAGQARKETEPVKNYILLLLWPADPPFSPILLPLWTVDTPLSRSKEFSRMMIKHLSSDDGKKVDKDPNDPNMPALEDDNIFGYNNPIFDFSNDDEDDDVEADMNILDTTI